MKALSLTDLQKHRYIQFYAFPQREVSQLLRIFQMFFTHLKLKNVYFGVFKEIHHFTI